jgi:hypothetical protein
MTNVVQFRDHVRARRSVPMTSTVQSCNHVGARRGAKRKKRVQYLQLLREAVLKLIEVYGVRERFEGTKIRSAEVGNLNCALRMPLSGDLPAPSDDEKRLWVLRGCPRELLPYGLCVWRGAGRIQRLFYVDWDFNGDLYLRRFYRGDWEAEILRLVGHLGILGMNNTAARPQQKSQTIRGLPVMLPRPCCSTRPE